MNGNRFKFKAVIALISGWLIPGLGHLWIKKYNRAIIFFCCIALMTILGLIMKGRVYSFETQNPLTILAFFSDLGNGLFYLLTRWLGWGVGNLKMSTFEYGTAYIAGAGLLNYLVALDAYDIARGKKK